MQASLFDTDWAPARGPAQSQATLDSLGRDTSLKFRIVAAVAALGRPATDDDITEILELGYGRRFQRNVIARTRGLLEAAGWLQQGPDVKGRTGRPTHTTLLTQQALDEMSPVQ